MSEADRLRAAADLLDRWAAKSEYDDEKLLYPPVTDLLRAVAEQGKWLHHRQPELCPDHYIWTAAQRVADVILGGVDA